MKKVLLSILFFVLVAPVFAQEEQNHTICSFTEYHNSRNKDPETKVRRANIEKAIAKLKENGSRRREDVLMIPVVFHVLYTNASNNPTDAQLQSQIDILNEGFRKTNANVNSIVSEFKSIATDTKIEFCLAKVDPNGNETNGIERKQSTKLKWESEGPDGDECKKSSAGGLDGWDQELYMNIWSVPEMVLGQVIGYSSFPGETPWRDGIVMRHNALGDEGTASSTGFRSVGKVTVHEAGHYFGLYHMWGGSNCGDDEIFDTPTQQSASQGCPLTRSSCGSPLNNVQNYMDYSDPESCMAMFTKGQSDRMRDILTTTRINLANSGKTACSFSRFSYDLELSAITNVPATLCGTKAWPSIEIVNRGKETITSAVVKVYVGNLLIQTKNININLVSSASANIELDSIEFVQIGQNEITIVVESPNNQVDENSVNNENATNVAVVIGEEYEFYITTASMNSNVAIEIIDGSNISTQLTMNGSSIIGDESVQKTCLAAETCHEFVITDAFKGGANCGDEWSNGGTYVGGDRVVYNGQVYEAKWWTKGDTPGGGDPWKLIGECVNSDPTHVYGVRKSAGVPSIFEVAAIDYTSPQSSQGPCLITSINDLENSSTLSIFPNPFKNQINIRGIEEQVQIRIIDLTGRVVLQTSKSENTTISVEEIPVGMYLIQINGENTNTRSVILKK